MRPQHRGAPAALHGNTLWPQGPVRHAPGRIAAARSGAAAAGARAGVRPGPRAPSDTEVLGDDVLVHTEEVRRVVLPLEGTQPFVFRRTVGRAHTILALLSQKVDVDAARGMRAHGLPEAAGPCDACLG